MKFRLARRATAGSDLLMRSVDESSRKSAGWLAAIVPVRWSSADWMRLVAETLAISVVLITVFRLFPPTAFRSLSPYPFWIPVLLMSAQYGVIGGLFSTLVTTAVFFGIAMPPQLANQDFYSYAGTLLLYPSGWLTYALVIGGLRSLHMLHAAEMERSLEDARETTVTLGGGLERALKEIDRLERRIAGETSTVNAIIKALARIDLHDAETLIASFAGVIRDGVGAAGFTLYWQTPAGVLPVARVKDGEESNLSEALKIPASLLDVLIAGRGTISRLDPDALRLLPLGTICVVPIKTNTGGRSYGIIVIECLQPYQELEQAAQRAHLLGSALASILCACSRGFADTNETAPWRPEMM
jgi:hypothetical protein